MRKIIVLLIIILLLCSCSNNNYGIPAGYIDKEEHFDNRGFQDYTDYAKYLYDDINKVIDSNDYKMINESDISDIKGYFDNFKEFMIASDRLGEYDFNTSIISSGDYYKLDTKEGTPIGDGVYQKYDNYTLYYFDIESKTLYYIHANI